MRFENYLIAFLVFSVVMATVGLVLVDANNVYNTDINVSEYGGKFDTINSTYSIATGQRNQTLGSNIDTEDTPNSLFTGSYSALTLLSGTFSMFGNIAYHVANQYPVPLFFVVAAITVVLILIVSTIIYLVFRVPP